MAFHLVAEPTWRSGAGTPPKYTFHLDVMVDVVRVVGSTATISVKGTYGATNYATNTSNAQKASDFAMVTMGTTDAWNYQFTPYQEYYEAALPVIPNAPQSAIDGVLLEFRGDTWRNDPAHPGNRSSLWQKGVGTVLDQFYGQNETRTFNIDTTFTVDVSDGDVSILSYVDSGWESGPIYEWMSHTTLVSFFQLDYRPSATWNGTEWLSHNRAGGVENIHTGSSWRTMRTVDGASGTGNPPLIKHAGAWYNQRKIGRE